MGWGNFTRIALSPQSKGMQSSRCVSNQDLNNDMVALSLLYHLDQRVCNAI